MEASIHACLLPRLSHPSTKNIRSDAPCRLGFRTLKRRIFSSFKVNGKILSQWQNLWHCSSVSNLQEVNFSNRSTPAEEILQCGASLINLYLRFPRMTTTSLPSHSFLLVTSVPHDDIHHNVNGVLWECGPIAENMLLYVLYLWIGSSQKARLLCESRTLPGHCELVTEVTRNQRNCTMRWDWTDKSQFESCYIRFLVQFE